MNIQLKSTTFGGEISFLDSKTVRYIRGAVTLDAASVAAVNGIKKLAAGTFIGKLGSGKYAKYAAGTPAVAATLNTGVVGNNNAITWTAKVAGLIGNSTKIKIEDTGVNGQALDVVIDDDAIVVKAARGAGVAAFLDTGVVGNNNAVTFTAKVAGVAGNGIKVSLIDPAGNNQPLEVKLVNNEIRIMLATSGVGAITTTGAQAIAAVNSALVVKDLVVASNTGASTGAAAVVAVAATALATGADGVITSTAAEVIAAVNAHLTAKTLVTAANQGVSTGAAAVAAVAITPLAGGAAEVAANVVPTLIIPHEVLFTTGDANSGLTDVDQLSTAIDQARVITARLPVAPDATVKASMPGITFA